MITPANRASPQSPESRDALQRSEKKASESQPESFNDKALTDKVVEVPALGNNQAPIKGLDPKPPR